MTCTLTILPNKLEHTVTIKICKKNEVPRSANSLLKHHFKLIECFDEE